MLEDQLTKHCCAPRGVGRRFEHHRVTRGQRRTDLGEVDLMREIPGGDRSDHADRLPDDRPMGLDAHRRRDACISRPLVRLRGIGAETEVGDRALQLRHRCQHHRRAHLGDGDLAQFFNVFGQDFLQLTQAPHPQHGVRRPVGVVERAAGRPDRGAHIVGGRVGRDTEHLFGRRVDGSEGAPAARHQLAVDEQLTLTIVQQAHTNSPLLCWTTVRLGSLER